MNWFRLDKLKDIPVRVIACRIGNPPFNFYSTELITFQLAELFKTKSFKCSSSGATSHLLKGIITAQKNPQHPIFQAPGPLNQRPYLAHYDLIEDQLTRFLEFKKTLRERKAH